eukprot:scaffold150438_cov20-Prasinocladus_malaysianus.AAC.1
MSHNDRRYITATFAYFLLLVGSSCTVRPYERISSVVKMSHSFEYEYGNIDFVIFSLGCLLVRSTGTRTST